MALRTFTLSHNYYHQPFPECFHHSKHKLLLTKTILCCFSVSGYHSCFASLWMCTPEISYRECSVYHTINAWFLCIYTHHVGSIQSSLDELGLFPPFSYWEQWLPQHWCTSICWHPFRLVWLVLYSKEFCVWLWGTTILTAPLYFL